MFAGAGVVVFAGALALVPFVACVLATETAGPARAAARIMMARPTMRTRQGEWLRVADSEEELIDALLA
jgi:hypothetical protein